MPEGMIEVAEVEKKLIAWGGTLGVSFPKFLMDQFDCRLGDDCTIKAFRGNGFVEFHVHFDKTQFREE